MVYHFFTKLKAPTGESISPPKTNDSNPLQPFNKQLVGVQMEEKKQQQKVLGSSDNLIVGL